MPIRLSFLITLLLGGCATLERHPVLTAVGSALIAGSIAATVEAHQGRRDARQLPESCHATMQCVTR